MLFTLFAEKNILEDQINHASIDHPEFSPEQLDDFILGKRKNLEGINRTIEMVKGVTEKSIF